MGLLKHSTRVVYALDQSRQPWTSVGGSNSTRRRGDPIAKKSAAGWAGST